MTERLLKFNFAVENKGHTNQWQRIIIIKHYFI